MVTSSDTRSTTREHFRSLLYTIYINDFPEVLKHVTAYRFADDTKCIYPSHTLSDQIAFQGDLNNVCNWSKKWKLSFNFTKCAVLQFWKEGTEQVIYTLNGSIIESKSAIKHLGLIIDSDL